MFVSRYPCTMDSSTTFLIKKHDFSLGDGGGGRDWGMSSHSFPMQYFCWVSQYKLLGVGTASYGKSGDEAPEG